MQIFQNQLHCPQGPQPSPIPQRSQTQPTKQATIRNTKPNSFSQTTKNLNFGQCPYQNATKPSQNLIILYYHKHILKGNKHQEQDKYSEFINNSTLINIVD